jgi:hypothetical protein
MPRTSDIDGWEVGGSSVDWVGTYWPAQEGAMSIDLSGADAGSVSQTFDTRSATPTRSRSRCPAIRTATHGSEDARGQRDGGTTGLYAHDVTGTDLTTMAFTHGGVLVPGDERQHDAHVLEHDRGPVRAGLDNVVVTESVPVKDDCKNGGWQSMIDNAGNSFKNQGDASATSRRRARTSARCRRL